MSFRVPSMSTVAKVVGRLRNTNTQRTAFGAEAALFANTEILAISMLLACKVCFPVFMDQRWSMPDVEKKISCLT